MLQEINGINNEFKYNWDERTILSIAALKLGYQVFLLDLGNSAHAGEISQEEYNRHLRWYLKQIRLFNKQLNNLKTITSKEVLPLENRVRQIINTGIYLSTNQKYRRKGTRLN